MRDFQKKKFSIANDEERVYRKKRCNLSSDEERVYPARKIVAWAISPVMSRNCRIVGSIASWSAASSSMLSGSLLRKSGHLGPGRLIEEICPKPIAHKLHTRYTLALRPLAELPVQFVKYDINGIPVTDHGQLFRNVQKFAGSSAANCVVQRCLFLCIFWIIPTT